MAMSYNYKGEQVNKIVWGDCMFGSIDTNYVIHINTKTIDFNELNQKKNIGNSLGRSTQTYLCSVDRFCPPKILNIVSSLCTRIFIILR